MFNISFGEFSFGTTKPVHRPVIQQNIIRPKISNPAPGGFCYSGHQLQYSNRFCDCDGCKEKNFVSSFGCRFCGYDLCKECYAISTSMQRTNFGNTNNLNMNNNINYGKYFKIF
jgi:hypothetical protein